MSEPGTRRAGGEHDEKHDDTAKPAGGRDRALKLIVNVLAVTLTLCVLALSACNGGSGDAQAKSADEKKPEAV